MARKTDQRRLRIRLNPMDRSSQVVDAAPEEDAQTTKAERVMTTTCHKCCGLIGRDPFHQVNDLYYHAACSRSF